jgi:AhpD family alkylhydroperoxidase
MAAPRIAPGSRRELGPVNALICRIAATATRTPPPNLFTTLGRHRRLFRGWLRFAGRLMPGGRLPRRDTELVILRVAHLRSCDYEWVHHERLGRRAGLSEDQIARVAVGPDADGWSPHERTLLRAVEELHSGGDISDETWQLLAAEFDERELIELVMLAGHYEMLATFIGTFRIAPDAPVRAR